MWKEKWRGEKKKKIKGVLYPRYIYYLKNIVEMHITRMGSIARNPQLLR